LFISRKDMESALMIGEEYPLLLLLSTPLNLIFGETNMESITNEVSIIAEAVKYFLNSNKEPARVVIYKW
jgi:hypothetical protein